MDLPPEFEDENPMDAGGYDENELNEGDEIMDETDMFNSNEMEMDEEHRAEGNFEIFKLNLIRFLEPEKPVPVTVNRGVIDLELVIQSFKANALAARLNYIAEACPPLRADALRALLDYLRKVNLRLKHIYTCSKFRNLKTQACIWAFTRRSTTTELMEVCARMKFFRQLIKNGSNKLPNALTLDWTL
jgi:hypothetical protein